MYFDTLITQGQQLRYLNKNAKYFKKLAKKYGLSLSETQTLMLIYYKILLNGPQGQTEITRSQFIDVLHNALDVTYITLHGRMLSALDIMYSVSKEAFIRAFSILVRGSREKRVDYAYKVYDYMFEGFLSKDNILYLLKESFITEDPEEMEDVVKDFLELWIKKVDADRDTKISMADYKTTCMREPMVIQSLGCCLPSRASVYAFLSTYSVPKKYPTE